MSLAFKDRNVSDNSSSLTGSNTVVPNAVTDPASNVADAAAGVAAGGVPSDPYGFVFVYILIMCFFLLGLILVRELREAHARSKINPPIKWYEAPHDTYLLGFIGAIVGIFTHWLSN